MISYAQNFEDVILRRTLRDVAEGFYIDIGAQHPMLDSVSLSFYEAGWSGVHVEPISHYADLLRQSRPTDQVIQAAIGRETGRMTLYEVPHTGLSTGVEAVADSYALLGLAARAVDVDVVTLASVLDGVADRDVHWLKIDCEGMEADVIASWAPSPVRPWIVVVDSTSPGTNIPCYEHWEPTLEGMGYRFAYSDTLNRFYVSESKLGLLKSFGPPPNCFDDFQTSILTQEFNTIGQEIAARRSIRDTLLHTQVATEDQRHARVVSAIEALSVTLNQKLTQAERALADQTTRLALANELLAGCQDRLEQEISQREGFSHELNMHRQILMRLNATVAERDAELARIFADPTWKALRPWRNLRKGLARTRRKLKKSIARTRRRLLSGKWTQNGEPMQNGLNSAGKPAHDLARTPLTSCLLVDRADDIMIAALDAQTTPSESL
ncbi:FkbM family methyltransferase [Brevundimonas sp.]|uniref:FkbM family methyltransferase n=1 Tax=Brevundimonas sp. TaxID=1871086 RepID=UPI0025C0E4AA|nr:FkbM family methyltransferase [Brevundimonas sp.]MBA4332288.1 FkbM family methyltransferase [Brevundimonas sp.]